MPREQVRVVGRQVELALVALADAPPPFNEATIVQDALAVLAADLCAPLRVRMGIHMQHHRFFRVVKGNIAGRFLMNHEVGADSERVGVVELTLAGRAGAAGLFPEAKHQDTLQLDMLSTLRLLNTKTFSNLYSSGKALRRLSSTCLSLTQGLWRHACGRCSGVVTRTI